ncbi:hypothetical protein ACFQ9X_04075 [Catenulispora yoronensis]
MATSDRLEQMVGDLVQIVENAKAVPMSASCVINRAEVMEILHELAEGLAEELAESRRLVAEREEVIAQARRDAAEHIEAARRERGSMLSGTEMGREAERIRGAALEEAQRIREEADNYVDDKLANFEVVLTKTLQAVGRGRAKMIGRDPMSELGEHVAEQDAAEAATRPEYEYDERDDHVPSGSYQREPAARVEYHTGEYAAYADEGYEQQPNGYQAQPSFQEAPSYQDAVVYQEVSGYQEVPAYQQAAYAQPEDAYNPGQYGLPEPELSHEFAQADMSGVFQRPDFSQDYPRRSTSSRRRSRSATATRTRTATTTPTRPRSPTRCSPTASSSTVSPSTTPASTPPTSRRTRTRSRRSIPRTRPTRASSRPAGGHRVLRHRDDRRPPVPGRPVPAVTPNAPGPAPAAAAGPADRGRGRGGGHVLTIGFGPRPDARLSWMSA